MLPSRPCRSLTSTASSWTARPTDSMAWKTRCRTPSGCSKRPLATPTTASSSSLSSAWRSSDRDRLSTINYQLYSCWNNYSSWMTSRRPRLTTPSGSISHSGPATMRCSSTPFRLSTPRISSTTSTRPHRSNLSRKAEYRRGTLHPSPSLRIRKIQSQKQLNDGWFGMKS